MDLNGIVSLGTNAQASDIHIEDGLSIFFRIGSKLKNSSEKISRQQMETICKKIIGRTNWNDFLIQGSWDLSRVIEGNRCRINVFRTSRGFGLAIRLLISRPISVKNLNLHPDLLNIIEKPHGLVLFSGPTGSGKSSTMAALIEEINIRNYRHIITLEHPIEYFFNIKKSLIRQREVGRDTPTFAQGLKDCLREDPDVIVVGEMRDQEAMRLTLNAAETGHLVFATVHSSTAPEAVARMIGSFHASEQDSVKQQLADTLVGVICQNMTYRDDVGLNVPECEILFSNDSVRSIIRSGNTTKLKDSIMTGAKDHMWSLDRYRNWLARKSDWFKQQNFPDFSPEEASPRPAYNPIVSTKVEEKQRKPSVTSKQRKNIDDYESEPDIVIEDDDDLGSILEHLK